MVFFAKFLRKKIIWVLKVLDGENNVSDYAQFMSFKMPL